MAILSVLEGFSTDRSSLQALVLGSYKSLRTWTEQVLTFLDSLNSLALVRFMKMGQKITIIILY